MNPTFGTGGSTTIALPPASFFTGGHVDTNSVSVTVGNAVRVPNATSLYYVNPLDPNNTFDPLIGRYVYRRDITVLSKATVKPPAGGGGPVTAYIEEKVSVRGAPLFAYAIFYSGNDLEFGETPQMDIYGAVHVNGNLFVAPAGPSGSTPSPLTFHGQVTASGNVFHAWRGTTGTAQENSSIMSPTTAVNFSTDSTIGGSPTNMKNATTGIWCDSTMGADSSTSGIDALNALLTAARNQAFKDYASQTWNGNLETAAMGITSYNLMGSTEAVAADSSGNPILATESVGTHNADDATVVGTTALGTGYGHGYGPHSLIEPPMAAAPSTDPYQAAKASVEETKFSNKASLYVKVQVDSSNAGTITLYGDPRSAPSGTPSSNIGPNGGIKLGTVPSAVIQYIPYSTSGTGSNIVVKTGIYDQRQDKGVNLVQIDMQKLKTALTDMAGSTTTANTDIVATDGTKWGLDSGTPPGYDKYTASSTGWNGGIYVEVASASTNQTAVLLANGKVNTGSTLLPTGTSAPNGVTGLTLATNAPAYILGNFNADGTIASTSATNNSALYPDDVPASTTAANLPAAVIASKESPVAIAADAVTVLSPNFFNTSGAPISTTAMTGGSAYNSYKQTSAPSASGGVEIAAAIISGTVTTSKDSTGTQVYSGGVHNFPRFLENWGSNTVAIRGAMVCMYNSRIASAGWSQSYYSAPVRQWGFDQIFAYGKYPPICPQVLQYRRVDFTYLKNAAAYASELSTL